MDFTGIHHLALVTPDIEETIRFWRDLIGLRLVAGVGRPGHRQYFFEISRGHLLAFFEWPQAERVPLKDHGAPVARPLGFDHVAIGVASEESLWDLKERLDAAGFWVSEVVDLGFIHSIYSFDPNQIPIEFSFCVEDIGRGAVPRLQESAPPPAALEGAEPIRARWPQVRTPTPRHERRIYPGEGGIRLRERTGGQEQDP